MPIKKSDARGLTEMAWPAVRAHVLDLADSLDALLATIQGRLARNDRNLSLFNLGFRALHEVRRVAESLEGDIEQIAWSVRNLHEIDLTLRYILQSEEHLAEWNAQMLTDEKDVVEEFSILAPKMLPRDRARLEQRLAVIREASLGLGVEMRRPWSMRALAKASDREHEYQIFYKFFSKFVHPSSWLVNGRQERTGAPAYRNLIVGLAQVLCRRIYGLLFDEYKLEECDVVTDSHCGRWASDSE